MAREGTKSIAFRRGSRGCLLQKMFELAKRRTAVRVSPSNEILPSA